MPTTNTAPNYLESLTEELLAKYRRLDSIVNHAPTKGTYHEKILRDVIRDYLPNTFSTGEGFIINIDSEVSYQLDILIVDNLDPRSFGYKSNDFYIASDIAVVCFGEVKTYCTKREFIKAFHKLVDSKMIIKDLPARVTSFLFCYDARASTESFKTWIDDAIAEYPRRDVAKPWHFPDYVFCFKKNIFHERRSPQGGRGIGAMQYWNATQRDNTSNFIQQKMLQELFQCVTNGCGRMRKYQGIRMARETTPAGEDF